MRVSNQVSGRPEPVISLRKPISTNRSPSKVESTHQRDSDTTNVRPSMGGTPTGQPPGDAPRGTESLKRVLFPRPPVCGSPVRPACSGGVESPASGRRASVIRRVRSFVLSGRQPVGKRPTSSGSTSHTHLEPTPSIHELDIFIADRTLLVAVKVASLSRPPTLRAQNRVTHASTVQNVAPPSDSKR